MELLKTAKRLMAGLLFAAALPAMAGVIDQQVAPDSTMFCFGEGSGCRYQQVVTPGMSGLLTSLQVYGIGNADLRFAPGSGVVAGGWTAQLLHVDIEHLIDLSSYGIYLTAGSSFVFELSNPSEYEVLQGAALPGGFPNKLYGDFGGGYTEIANQSLAYITTVDRAPTAVPEPQTAALVLIGLALLGAATRRTDRRASVRAA